MMIYSRIKVINVEYEKRKVEFISAQIRTKNEETQKIEVAYVRTSKTIIQ